VKFLRVKRQQIVLNQEAIETNFVIQFTLTLRESMNFLYTIFMLFNTEFAKVIDMCTCYRQTHQSSFTNQKAADKILEKPEEKIISESNIAQSESQIIEEDDTAIFDAPQKKTISKPIESNNCSKVKKEDLKPEDQSTKKSVGSNAQSASQIIEDEDSPIMNFSECIEDVSCFIIIYIYIICIKVKLHIKYIAVIYYRF